MLKAIFYARFHPERGPSVIHQFPADFVQCGSSSSSINSTNAPTSSSTKPSPPHHLSWTEISSYIIPPYDLCNRPLSICTADGFRVLGFPISLEDGGYDRNRFTYNVCYVLDDGYDERGGAGEDGGWDDGLVISWQQIVRKTGRFFQSLEEEDGTLQAEERIEGLKWAGEDGYPNREVGVVYGLLERVVQDLGRFGEVCARVGSDGVHVLNLRLEGGRRRQDTSSTPVVKVRAWDVPLLIRKLPTVKEWTWDLTLARIFQWVDGIRHVKKIAELADVEVKLVKRAVKELVLHDLAILLDIFHFQAIYACTADFALFVQDERAQDECRKYIAVKPAKAAPASLSSSSSATTTTAAAAADEDIPIPTREATIHLYTLLQPGLQLCEFCTTHKPLLGALDIRRLITYGIAKGILRRIHKFALAQHNNTATNSDPFLTNPSPPASSLSHTTATAAANTRLSALPSSSSISTSATEDATAAARDFDRAWRKAALSSGWATPPSGPHPAASWGRGGGGGGGSHRSAEEVRSEEDEKLKGFLDGNCCLDRVCVEMGMSEKSVGERLRGGRFGPVVMFNK